jgi:hypothetical protein
MEVAILGIPPHTVRLGLAGPGTTEMVKTQLTGHQIAPFVQLLRKGKIRPVYTFLFLIS